MAAIVGGPTYGWDGANNTTVASAAKNTTTGNLLAVCVTTQEGAGSTTIDSVADTAGNTYTAGTHYGAGGGGGMARWFYAYNITGNASNVVTATMSGNTRYKGIHQVEISGLDTTSAVLSGQSGGVALGSATISPGNITLSAAGIFLYGVVATNDRSFTPDGAYTEYADAQDGWGGSSETAYDIDTGSTDNPTATASSASNLTIAAIAFLDASGGGGDPSPNIPGRRFYVMP